MEVASSMYHIVFIQLENIAVDEIEKINIYSHLLARIHEYIYFYLKLSCMHEQVSCNIVVDYSAAQYE